MVTARPHLFQAGSFKLSAGGASAWKIECDALTKADWEGIARIAFEILPPFGAVQGVPRGGVPFADALRKYATGDANHALLLAEDVITTGGSITKYRAALPREPVGGVWGVCVFARGTVVPRWCIPLFTFNYTGTGGR